MVQRGEMADIEAYLMAKWLGKARAGYSDFSAATVAGSGTITANTLSQLPALGAGFSGNAVIATNVFAFTVSTNAVGQYTVSRSVAFPARLTVPASGTVSVTFLAKPKSGSYTLLSYGSAAGTGFAGWSLTTSGSKPNSPVRLRATATALSIAVIPQGTLTCVR